MTTALVSVARTPAFSSSRLPVCIGHDYAGHGIGLSIVRRAVERHGGRVWAEAAPDEGASFYSRCQNAGIEALSITEPLANAAEVTVAPTRIGLTHHLCRHGAGASGKTSDPTLVDGRTADLPAAPDRATLVHRR